MCSHLGKQTSGDAHSCTAREFLGIGHLKLTRDVIAARSMIHARKQLQACECPEAESEQCQSDDGAKHWECIDESTDNCAQVVKSIDSPQWPQGPESTEGLQEAWQMTSMCCRIAA